MKIPFTDEPTVSSAPEDEYPIELFRDVRKSKKFREWQPQLGKLATEKHYSVNELASLWGVGVDTIRLLFEKENGVLIIGNAKGTRSKRRYRTFKIPESVAMRVHSRFSSR